MTAQTVAGKGSDSAQAIAAWQDVRGASDIQFAPSKVPPPDPTPEWLMQLNRFLADLFAPLGRLLGLNWNIFQWVLWGGMIVLALLIVWRIVMPMWAARRRTPPRAADEWVPDREDAMALLEDADRLAAEGRFAEATHLLLRRSVGQIAEARPRLVPPSATAREIAGMAELPPPARTAFATIASEVERSLFALRDLGAVEWARARDAYARFALADLRAGAGA